MKRKRNVIQLTGDQIKEFRSQRRTYEDFGFDHQLNKKSVLKEQERVRKELRGQEEHEMKMRLYREQLNNTQSRANPENKVQNNIKKRWCNYDHESKTFQITQNNGQILALTFRPFDGKVSGQTILFEVGYELWKNGTIQILRSETITRCSIKAAQYNLNQITIDSNWLKQTRKNLRTTIDESQVAGLIEVFEIEKSQNGSYRFSIKSS